MLADTLDYNDSIENYVKDQAKDTWDVLKDKQFIKDAVSSMK
jgi:hypothetical protein